MGRAANSALVVVAVIGRNEAPDNGSDFVLDRQVIFAWSAIVRCRGLLRIIWRGVLALLSWPAIREFSIMITAKAWMVGHPPSRAHASPTMTGLGDAVDDGP